MTSIRRPPPEVPYGSGSKPYVEQHDRDNPSVGRMIINAILLLVVLWFAIPFLLDHWTPSDQRIQPFAEDN